MLGLIKTDTLYLAKIGLTKNKDDFRKSYRSAFVVSIANSANSLDAEGWYKYATKNQFVAEEQSCYPHSQTYAYDVQKFNNAYPKIRRKVVSKLYLKHLEKSLNKENSF